MFILTNFIDNVFSMKSIMTLKLRSSENLHQRARLLIPSLWQPKMQLTELGDQLEAFAEGVDFGGAGPFFAGNWLFGRGRRRPSASRFCYDVSGPGDPGHQQCL